MNKELVNTIPTLALIENPEDINASTRIAEDLGLTTFQAIKFINDYADKFNVELNHFDYNKYFPAYIPVISIFKKKHPLTLGCLQEAISYGQLNDEIINKTKENAEEKPPHKKLYFKNKINYRPEEILIYVLLAIAILVVLSLVTLFV